MKLTDLPQPSVAGVVREKTVADAIAEISNCLYDGADMIDLHMSCLDDPSEENLKRIISSTTLPVLALNYNQKLDWSNAGYTEEEREDLFIRAIKAGASGVDIQGYTFDVKSKNGYVGEDKYSFTKNNPKEIVTDKRIIQKQTDFIKHVHDLDGQVLLSCHPNVVMNCDQVVDLALFLQERNPDIIKIVTASKTNDDLLESFKTMIALKEKVKTPVTYHVNGKVGKLSRIINPILGGQIAFCVDRYKEGSTMEQLDLKSARRMVDDLKKLL